MYATEVRARTTALLAAAAEAVLQSRAMAATSRAIATDATAVVKRAREATLRAMQRGWRRQRPLLD